MGVFFSRPKVSSPTRRVAVITEEISSTVQKAKQYSYEELRTATGDFHVLNKLGQGGFGSVYKGTLNDGTEAAIKVLSAQSEQGVREFLNEIDAISGVEHENLVRLHGCCAEGYHRILVYGYVENNSLAQTLLGRNCNKLQFSWKTRSQICIGVAQGLAFLHEEVKPPIVHRDIKASNVLLDQDFTPKIADFGLARLFPNSVSHINTRVAGTIGYVDPEYEEQGELTLKADIYSFGVLLLEIVSGRRNKDKRLPAADQNLVARAWTLYQKGRLVELVDEALMGDSCTDEACKYLQIGLLCTQKAKNRLAMSIVAKMLKGETDLDKKNGKLKAPHASLLGSCFGF